MKVIDEWKPIKDFENYYINRNGEIKSTRAFKGTKVIILKGSLNNKGYKTITMIKNGKVYNKTIHRLLMETFIPNPHNYKCINHKDGNKLNNSLDNLEWCDYGHNEKEAYRLKLKEPRLKPRKIKQLDKHSGELIRIWNSSYSPYYELGYSASNINMCCNGKRKTANGYIWRFVDENNSCN